MKKVTAKSLIIDLMMALKGRPMSAKQAIIACAIFDISVNNTRVALVRLSAEGLIESTGRAMYQLTEDAHTLADEVAAWRTRSKRVRPWDGSYIMVHTHKLPRTEALRERDRARALLMLGFREMSPSVYIRPNNVEDSIDTVRTKLYKLGLEPEAPVYGASHFDAIRRDQIARLWAARELETTYATQEKKIRMWLDKYKALEPEEAARESFLLGNAAIKHVVYDPFLPDELVDTRARERFLRIVDELDRIGIGVWNKLWQEHENAQ